MMKILFVIPTLSGGGAERVCINLVNALSDDPDIHITVLTLFADRSASELKPAIEYQYIFRHKLPGYGRAFKLFPPSMLYQHLIAKRGIYDVVISFLQGSLMRVVAGAFGRKERIINWVHSFFPSYAPLAKCFRSRKEFGRLITRFDANVFVSNAAKEAFLSMATEIDPDKCHTIYNINDFAGIIRASHQKLDDVVFSAEEFNIISAGRFVPVKAFDRLINVVASLHNSNHRVHLYLLGQGPLEKELKTLAKNLHAEKFITIVGQRSNPYKYIRRSNLYVCSSLYEGYSTAVTEALVLGCPVVSTACAGMGELLGENEYGIITQNDTKALKDGIESLLNDKMKYDHYCRQAVIRGQQLQTLDNLTPVKHLFDTLVQP